MSRPLPMMNPDITSPVLVSEYCNLPSQDTVPAWEIVGVWRMAGSEPAGSLWYLFFYQLACLVCACHLGFEILLIIVSSGLYLISIPYLLISQIPSYLEHNYML